MGDVVALKEKKNLELYRVFTAQKAIYDSLSIYEDLYSLTQRKSFDEVSNQLLSIYANKSDEEKKPLIKNLFLVWLVLAPILDKQRYSFKLDWTKSNFFSWVGFYTNQNNKYYFALEKTFEVYSSSELEKAFKELKIVDKKFIKLAIDAYLAFYGSYTVFGKLAKSIFNKVFFALEKQEKDSVYLVRNNKLLILSKKQFAESKNIIKEPVKMWDYQIQKLIIKDKKSPKREIKTMITIAKEPADKFKEYALKCESQRQLYALCNSFCESHKYVFDALKRMQELNAFIHDKRKIKFTHNISLVKIYLDKSQKIKDLKAQTTSTFLPSVFSRDYKEIEESVYLHNLFNPYKEF